MNVLLIEPDKVLSNVYQAALTSNGHHVVAVASAQAAVQAADEETPDLVIMEPQLPRHNGIEFLYEFRSYHEWLNIPVIVHSFTPPEQLFAPILQAELGVVCVLHKPKTSLSDLVMVVGQTVTV